MICDSCGKEKDDVFIRINPKARELSNVEIHMPLYDDCYEQTAMDI